MNKMEIEQSLKSLRLSGMSQCLDTRVLQAQTESMPHVSFLGYLVQDELSIRRDRLIDRRIKSAHFRDSNRTLENFDFGFNVETPKSKIFELATSQFIEKKEDALFLGPPGTGKSHLVQAIGRTAILNGYQVYYWETHLLLEALAEANLDGRRAEFFKESSKVDLLIVDDLGMRKLPSNAAEDLLELIMRRHNVKSTIITSNRPVEDWGTFLHDVPAVTALLDRMLEHGRVIKCGPKSYRTHMRKTLPEKAKEN